MAPWLWASTTCPILQGWVRDSGGKVARFFFQRWRKYIDDKKNRYRKNHAIFSRFPIIKDRIQIPGQSTPSSNQICMCCAGRTDCGRRTSSPTTYRRTIDHTVIVFMYVVCSVRSLHVDVPSVVHLLWSVSSPFVSSFVWGSFLCVRIYLPSMFRFFMRTSPLSVYFFRV